MRPGELVIHHIGYLVKNLDKAMLQFEILGYKHNGLPIYDDYRGIDIAFLEKDGYKIELVCPRDSKSIVGNLRKKIGNTPYHICYEVDNLENAIEELGKLRFVIWEQPHEALAIDCRRVVFLFSSQMGMIELVEK